MTKHYQHITDPPTVDLRSVHGSAVDPIVIRDLDIEATGSAIGRVLFQHSPMIMIQDSSHVVVASCYLRGARQ